MKINYTYFTYTLVFIWSCLPGQSMAQEAASDSINRYVLDPVVITGTRNELQKSKIPSPVSVVSRADIENSNLTNVLPLLSYQVPGLFVNERTITGFGVGPESAGGISMRGLSTSGDPSNTRVLVLVDGQPQFMGVFGHPISDAYLSSDIERIEVIRGPASVLYGTNAMGGAINLITRKKEKDGFNIGLNTAVGSFNTQQYNVHGGYKSGKLGIFAGGNYDKTEGHRTDGTGDFVNKAGFLKIKYDLNDQISLSADANYSEAEFLDPGTEAEPRLTNNWYQFDRGRVAFSIDNAFSKVEGALRFFYNFGEHRFSNNFFSEDFNYGFTFYQNYSYHESGVLTLGVDLKHFGGNAINPMGITMVDNSINETDIYALLRQNIGEFVTASAGYRLVNNSLFGIEHVPYTGLTWKAGLNTNLKGTISKGFRSPTLANLFIGAASNDELGPERMWNYDVTIVQNLFNNKLNVELTGFIANGENLIRNIGGIQFINTGEFRHKGIEMSAEWIVDRNLNIRMNYTHLNMEVPQQIAPENDLNLIVNYTWNKLGLMLTSRYVSGLLLRQEDNMDVKESYFLLNLQASYKITPWIELFARGENLTDTQYYIQNGYIMPGIYGMGGMKFRISN